MKKIVFILLLTVALNEAKLPIPKGIQTCSRSDPNINECFAEKATFTLSTYLPNGDPKYNMKPFKSHIWKELFVDIEIPTFKFTFDNITITGLENSIIDKPNIDFDKKSIHFVMLNPEIIWSGQYAADFKVNEIHKTFDGAADISYRNGTFNVNLEYELYTSDGEEYANITKYYAEFEEVDIYLNFPALDAEPLVHDVWEKTQKNFGNENTERKCGRVQANYFNKIFNVVPWNEVFTP